MTVPGPRARKTPPSADPGSCPLRDQSSAPSNAPHRRQGYVVIPDVLDHATCDAVVAKLQQRAVPMDKTPDGYESRGTWESAHTLWEAGEPFIREPPGLRSPAGPAETLTALALTALSERVPESA